MKNFFIIFATVVLSATVLFTGCANNEAMNENGLVSGDKEVIAYDFEPLTFYSFDDFVDAVVNVDVKSDMHNLSGIDHYYIPAESIKNISLDAITVKERYVCLYYYLKDLTGVEYSSADDEEIARIANTVKLEWTRNDDGETLLSNTIKQLSLKELSNGVYYYDICYPTQPNIVLSKSLFWVHDDYMFNLDIPKDVYETLSSKSDSSKVLTAVETVQIGD